MRDSIVNGLNNIELLTHSLVSSLSNLPSNIINLLEQLFNKLFVPTDTPFDDIKNIFNTKYPIINQITDITSGLFGEYGDTDTPPQFFVTINGKQCNILSLDWYAPYRHIVKGILICLAWLYFVFWIVRYSPRMLGGVT